MDASAQTQRAGRIAAIAALVVSAALFVTALLGIATLDPGANASPTAPATPTRSVSLQDDARDSDCPWKKEQRERERRDAGLSS